ncbi:hypothetical protein EIP86_002304 [Pleurotus ostreatoroseus]|nr:hypothetical protein EIP86_002304 [Pleurotus ostreatoroseus]
MPPKRKRTEEATAAAPRATRASARKKSDAGSEDTTSKASGSTNEVPAAKRAKKATTKSTRSRGTKSSATERASEDLSTASNKLNDTNGPPLPSHAVNTAKPAKSSKTSENEPYSPERVNELFDTYADADDPSVIGADGFIQLCTDTSIAMEGSLPLLLHWLLNAEDMMKIQKSEWDKVALNDFEQLLIENQPALKPPMGSSSTAKKKTVAPSEPYNRSRYYACAADPKSFDELYKYCFNLPKTECVLLCRNREPG